MHRINTLRDSRYEYACPTVHKHRDVRVIDGHFECRSCGQAFQEIVHLPTGERLRRDDVEIVGPHASHQAAIDPRENV
jgi:ribosomal protein L37AE/L43A